MPSGKNHDRITWLCLPWIIFCTAILTREGLLTLLMALGFIFSGLMFGPDLDIYSIQYQRWGKLKFLWIPYQKTLKHRSFFSHGFLIGTIIRLIYLFLICWIVAVFSIAILQLIWGFNWNWQNFMINIYQRIKLNFFSEFIFLFIGLELGAMSHYLADIIGSWLKLKQKNENKSKTKTVIKKRRKKS